MMVKGLVLAVMVGGVAWGQVPATTPGATTPAATVPAASAPASDLPDAPSTAGQVKPPAVPTGPTVVMDTTMGRLTCKLFTKEAPIAAANFAGLADGSKEWTDPVTLKKVKGKSFYQGVTFHRVIPGFMIQGGDRLGTGMGDAGTLFANEVDAGLQFDVPGRLAMANAGEGTNGSQFFITEAAQPDLNGKYTIFGQCDEHSVLLAASIARVERDANDKPLTPVVINRMTVVRDGQPLPAEPVATVAPAAAATAP